MSNRSYGQYCGVARALDLVGGRWTLLIVRELLVGPARYGELLEGLPGIATNLLTARLRELEEAGLVRRTLDTQAMAIVYELTPWGQQLRVTVEELVKWSTPLMVPGPGTDHFRNEWLLIAVTGLMRQKHSTDDVFVGFEMDAQVVGIRVTSTGTRVQLNPDPPPETVLGCEPAVLLGLASGMLSVPDAVATGDLRGRVEDLERAFGTSSSLAGSGVAR